MGSGGEGEKIGPSVLMASREWVSKTKAISKFGTKEDQPSISTSMSPIHQGDSFKKIRCLGQTAVILNGSAHDGIEQHLGRSLRAAQITNAELKAEHESLLRSLVVKTDILKTVTAAAKSSSAAATSEQQQEQQEACSRPIISRMGVGIKESIAEDAVCVSISSDGEQQQRRVVVTAAQPTTTPTRAEAAQHHQISSVNRLTSSSDIDYSDVTSSMIILRSHQGDLRSLLEEADEEGLTQHLMANIESTVAETTKIYSDLMAQRREHPAITNSFLISKNDQVGEAIQKIAPLDSTNIHCQSRSTALTILERLSHQHLMSLHGSWQSHSQNLELIQQKQSRLEVMRAALSEAIQKRGHDDVGATHQALNGKTRAAAYLAIEYLGKSTRDVYWEEWDAINKFEGTCCEILGTYNTAIMYVHSAPASPNCTAITQEILTLARNRGRLCLAL